MSDGIISPGVRDLYPTERNALLSIRHQLMETLSWKPTSLLFTEDMMKRQFEEQAKNRCGEIGFVVTVQWTWEDPETGDMSPDVSDDPNDMNIYYKPQLQIIDRCDKIEEVDHSRMRHEIVAGEADGRVGVLDPSTGKLKDPPKKVIT